MDGLNGQWLGRYSGTNQGIFVFDVDDLGDHYEGWVYLYDNNPALPGMIGSIATSSKANDIEVDVALQPIHPPLADPRDWQEISGHYPLVTAVATRARARIHWDATDLRANASTDIGTSVDAAAPRSAADLLSIYVPLANVSTWKEFRAFALDLEPDRYIFRGQQRPWRLRTRYHPY